MELVDAAAAADDDGYLLFLLDGTGRFEP